MHLQNLDVIIADGSEPVRQSIIGMLRQQGVRSCRGVHDLRRLRNAILEKPTDLIVAADDLDPNVFKLMRQLRLNQISANPFTVITMMVEPSAQKSFQKAIICGADDILIKPVAPKKIVDRAKHIAFNRLPFTATKDYMGPLRKQLNFDDRVPVLSVLNTLRDKMEGKSFTIDALRQAVVGCLQQVRSAQLDSHTLRLEYTCGLILKAYESRKVGPELQGYLAEVTDSLQEAAVVAEQIGQRDLAETCRAFATQIETMAKDYQSPEQKHLDLIGKLTRAFASARTQTARAS